MTFGENLREKRLKKNFTLRKFACEIGISAPILSEIENGDKVAPSDKVLKNIVDRLELTNSEADMLYDMAAETKTNNPIPADIT